MKFKVGDIIYRKGYYGIDILSIVKYIENGKQYQLQRVIKYGAVNPGHNFSYPSKCIEDLYILLTDEQKSELL